MKILHIDSSILGDQSISRKLSGAVVRQLLKIEPGSAVTYRDLAGSPLPQFSANIAAGVYAASDKDFQPSADLAPLCDALAGVLNADVIVIGAPMYNLTIPSQLKSWLDALAVPGKTFAYSSDGVKGLLGEKRVIIASSRGGFYGPESLSAGNEHQESYLRSFFGFLGVTRFEVIRAEGVRISPEIAEQALGDALLAVSNLEAA